MILHSWLSALVRGFGGGVDRRRARKAKPRSRRAAAAQGLELLEARALLTVTIGATNVDALVNDVDDGVADPGDTPQYTVTITNSGNMDATSVSLSDNEDANTTLVGGSIKVTPIAFDDAYSLTGKPPGNGDQRQDCSSANHTRHR